MKIEFSNFYISDDQSLLDYDVILGFLARSYWANQRPRETTIKSIQNSYCLGVYKDKEQIGFARIVTDYATVYYLCDVFIDEKYREQGIGKQLVETIVNLDMLEGLLGILGTKDAHELYVKYGFVREPHRFMSRRRN